MIFILLASLLFPIQTSHLLNVDKNGLALEGYDPVAYFESQPQKGDAALQIKYEGAIYYFSSESNKALFDANPLKYVPMYGGWCAYAMGLGPDKVKINPERFKILNGRLYLFYDFRWTDTLVLWEENEAELKRSADKNWKKILQ